jgi:hypothetical protein
MSTRALLSRRSFAARLAAAAGLLVVPACATMPSLTLEKAVRRLLLRSSERAFTRLTARGGTWDQAVAQVGLPRLLGVRGELLAGLLSAPPVKARLEGALVDMAAEGSARAVPVVTDAVRVIGIRDARAILRGGPSAATAYLRSAMGPRLIEVLAPDLGAALRMLDDPRVGDALAMLAGFDIASASRSFAWEAEDVIWRTIGQEEAAIRADPASLGDPLLAVVLAGANSR